MRGERTAVHILIIITNTVALLITTRTRNIMKVRANKIFASLLLCHLLYGIIDMAWEFTQPTLLTSFNFYFVHCGLCLMVMITLDRIFAIQKPFRYEITPTVVTYVMIISCFLLPLILLILQMIFRSPDFKIQAWSSMILIVFNIVVLSISNMLLFHITRKHIKCAKRQINSLNQNYAHSINPTVNIIASSNLSYQNDCKDTNRPNKGESPPIIPGRTDIHAYDSQPHTRASVTNSWSKKEVRAAYTCIGMVLSFTLLTLPWVIERVIRFSTGYKNELFWRVALFLTACTSVVDPILYILFNRRLRSKMFQTVVCCRKKLHVSSKRFESAVSPEFMTERE